MAAMKRRRRRSRPGSSPDISGEISDTTFNGPAAVVAEGSQHINVYFGPAPSSPPCPDAWPLVSGTSPLELGVHRARSISGAIDPSLPPYVRRDFDDELRMKLRQAAVDGGMILLIGDSTAGKSRAAFEAMRSELPEHKVFAPPHGADLRMLPDVLSHASGDYVLWLDDLEGFLHPDGLQPDVLSALIRLKTTVIATLRDGLRDTYRPRAERQAAASGDAEAKHRSHSGGAVLNVAEVVTIPRVWSAIELERAGWVEDLRLVQAVTRHGVYGLAEYLAAGPELWQEFRHAKRSDGSPRGYALVAAAIDLARTGLKGPYPARLLEELHVHYLAAAGGAVLRPGTLDAAWEWASAIRFGVTSLLLPGSGDSEWRAFDYLIDAASREADLRVREATWLAAIENARDDDERFEIGRQALLTRTVNHIADKAFRPLALSGDGPAANNMGVLAEATIIEQSRGNFFSSFTRMMTNEKLLDQSIDAILSKSVDDIVADPLGALRALGVAGTGDSAVLEEAARWYLMAYQAGYHEAASNLADAYRQRGLMDEAAEWYEKAAELNVERAAYEAARLAEGRNDLPAAEQWYRQAISEGDRRARKRLRGLLDRQGRTAESVPRLPRRPADRGADEKTHEQSGIIRDAAADVLADLLAEGAKWFKGHSEPDEAPAGDQPAGNHPSTVTILDKSGTISREWLNSGRRLFFGHDGPAYAACVIRVQGGRSLLASGGGDGTIRLWNPGTGAPASEPLPGYSDVHALCPVPLAEGGSFVASGDSDGQLTIWDCGRKRPVRGPFEAHGAQVSALSAVTVRDELAWIASGDTDGVIQLWDLSSGRPRSTRLGSETGPIVGLCPLAGDKGARFLVSAAGSSDRHGSIASFRLWDPATARAVREPFGIHAGAVRAICPALGPGGQAVLASGDDKGDFYLWNPLTGLQIGDSVSAVAGPVSGICCVSEPGAPAVLACVGENGDIALISVSESQVVASLHPGGHARPVRGTCAVPLSTAGVIAVAAAGGSWSPDGGNWNIQLWYPIAVPATDSGQDRRTMAARKVIGRFSKRAVKSQAGGTREVAATIDDDAVAPVFSEAVRLIEQAHLSEAEVLYRDAASAGHAAAINALGMLAQGKGDRGEAERLYRNAADSFLNPAFLNLGDLLKERGERKEAISWYRKFAESSSTADRDSVIRFLVDDQSLRRQKIHGMDILVNEKGEQELDPTRSFSHLEYTTAVTLINLMREWRTSHTPGAAPINMRAQAKNPLDSRELTASAAEAISRAASQLTPQEPLDTKRLFLALEAADAQAEWHRLWLEAGDPATLAALQAHDPQPDSGGMWREIKLTGTCAKALEIAVVIGETYGLQPLPIGALALGMIADPRSAASRSLCQGGLSRSALIELIQEITLNFTLKGLDKVLTDAVGPPDTNDGAE
jgi:WD40 repeat protein/TPR repeat protein